MKYRKSIYLAVAAMALSALAACSSSGEESAKQKQDAPRYEIRFTSNLTKLDTDATRAAGNYTEYTTGQVFWVWADMFDEYETPENQITSYFNAWKLTISSTTSQFSTTAANPSKSYPAYNTLNFYTLHGNFSEDIVEEAGEETGTEWPTSLTHTVLTEQLKEEDYQTSDLVFAINRDMMPSPNPVNLEFKHLLSQVEVALIPGNGMTANDLTQAKATVKLLDLKTRVQFTPNKAANLSTLADRVAMLDLENASDVADITISTVPTSNVNTATCGAAVVVPQTVNGKFVHISYLGYDTYVSVSNLTLKSGYRYRFNITVDRIGGEYSITPVTVEAWTAETDNRIAELQ